MDSIPSDPAYDPDERTLRERYRQEIYGERSPAFDADHWSLVDEPYRVLTIPERWPDRLPYEVAYESVRVWAAQAFGAFADEWPLARWSAGSPAFSRMLWPLPVGRAALGSEVERQNLAAKAGGLSPFHSRLLPEMMPFDGDEYAFLILRIPVRTSHVTMFGLAQPVDDDNGRAFRLTGCRFLLSSANPYDTKKGKDKDSDAARMKMVIGHVQRFWGKFEGTKYRGSMNAGRPPLSVRVHEGRRQKVAEWEEYKKKHPGVSWQQVAMNMNVPYGRLQKWRRGYGGK
ncbi:MAG: hypothetical protein M3008_08660 [Chloroflexota bacterium]|nr:hypothetical protein [Chloroflexota bacterium]